MSPRTSSYLDNALCYSDDAPGGLSFQDSVAPQSTELLEAIHSGANLVPVRFLFCQLQQRYLNPAKHRATEHKPRKERSKTI